METTPRSGSSGPCSQRWGPFGARASKGEWASTETWLGDGQQNHSERLLGLLYNPSSLTGVQVQQKSGGGSGLLLWAVPVEKAESPNWVGLSPSLSDHHSMRQKHKGGATIFITFIKKNSNNFT